jgi:hypothetical protein
MSAALKNNRNDSYQRILKSSSICLLRRVTHNQAKPT